jgi:hypothetical protein
MVDASVPSQAEVDCVYDVTFAFPPDKVPAVTDLMRQCKQDVFVYIKYGPAQNSHCMGFYV